MNPSTTQRSIDEPVTRLRKPTDLGYPVSSDETEDLDESKGPLDESGGTISDGENEVDEDVLEDIERFEANFQNITQRYRLINRIGEGTFSTVYKAEDLWYDNYENTWDPGNQNGVSHKSRKPTKARFVAIKKIYVTSSPHRILNELELLHDLRNAPNVCPLITAMRCLDQVVAVLPFFPHQDFREYYRDFTIPDVKIYLRSLFTALRSTHQAAILHRDIKPTNFLYSPSQKRGVLVDFGLAEREGTDFHQCPCMFEDKERNRRVNNSIYASTVQVANSTGQAPPRPTYPANDQRSSRRANRAGTRGFRAPEVLLKCTAQTCVIDIWSCGIILLTFLSHRFPFFHSADDIDAFIELCTIFGKKKMRETAMLHGQVLQTNIPTMNEAGHSWEKIILWCTHRSKKNADGEGGLSGEEQEAVEFMRACLELDPGKRISAAQALKHPFLAMEAEQEISDDMIYG